MLNFLKVSERSYFLHWRKQHIYQKFQCTLWVRGCIRLFTAIYHPAPSPFPMSIQDVWSIVISVLEGQVCKTLSALILQPKHASQGGKQYCYALRIAMQNAIWQPENKTSFFVLRQTHSPPPSTPPALEMGWKLTRPWGWLSSPSIELKVLL